MRSDDEITRIASYRGTDALTSAERMRLGTARKNTADRNVRDMDAATSFLAPVLVFGAAAYFLPIIALYLWIAFSLSLWVFGLVFWPRLVPFVLSALLIAGLFAGIGYDGRITLLWIDTALVATGDPMWDGPVSFAWYAVMTGPILGAIAIRCGLNPTPGDEYTFRPARGFAMTRTHSVLMALSTLMPVLALTPIVIWHGLFGATGLAEGEIMTRTEVVAAILQDPIAILRTGIYRHVLEPHGILVYPALFAIVIVILADLIYATFYVQTRIGVAAQARRDAATEQD